MSGYFRWVSMFLGFLLSGCVAASIVPETAGDLRSGTPAISPALQQKQTEVRVLKRKVAIGRFSNETKYGNSFFVDDYGDRVGKQAMDILSARLTETGKFLMLERADLQRIQDETRVGKTGPIDIPTDYLILGSVSEFGRKDSSDVGVFSRTKTQTVYAKVNIRLVDTRTGQIVYAGEGAGEAVNEAGTTMGLGSRAGYDATLNDKAISGAISKLIGNIIENLLDKPWRSYILSMSGGNYIIAGGKTQGIRVGDEFEVYEKGQVVTNPQTGLPIELPGTEVGRVKVVSTMGKTVDDELSICAVSGSSAGLPKNNFTNYYVSGK